MNECSGEEDVSRYIKMQMSMFEVHSIALGVDSPGVP